MASSSSSNNPTSFNPGEFRRGGLGPDDADETHWKGDIDENGAIHVAWAPNAVESAKENASILGVTTLEVKTATEKAACKLAKHMKSHKVKIIGSAHNFTVNTATGKQSPDDLHTIVETWESDKYNGRFRAHTYFTGQGTTKDILKQCQTKFGVIFVSKTLKAWCNKPVSTMDQPDHLKNFPAINPTQKDGYQQWTPPPGAKKMKDPKDGKIKWHDANNKIIRDAPRPTT